MLSGFSQLFDKAFAVGFLLPVLLGLSAVAWLFPELALTHPLHSLAADNDTAGKLIYLGLVVYAAAIALTMLNRPLYRFLEGYGPLGRVWPALARRQQLRRARLLRRYERLMRRWARLQDDFPARERAEADRLKRALVAYFPPAGVAVLPTAFGNVLRAFESYPLEAYGADGPPVWTRLTSVVTADFAGGVNAARAQVDCVVNMAALAAVVGAAALLASLVATPWPDLWRLAAGALQDPQATLHAALLRWRPDPRFWAGLALLASIYPLYRWAVDRAIAWGELVKAAFDCYLPALVKQLGYAVPAAEAERRSFWRDVNALFVYRQPFSHPWRTTDTPARAPPPRFAERDRR